MTSAAFYAGVWPLRKASIHIALCSLFLLATCAMLSFRAHRNTDQVQIYTFSGQFDYLCYNVTSYYNTTDKLEELIQENDETRWVRAVIGLGVKDGFQGEVGGEVLVVDSY